MKADTQLLILCTLHQTSALQETMEARENEKKEMKIKVTTGHEKDWMSSHLCHTAKWAHMKGLPTRRYERKKQGLVNRQCNANAMQMHLKCNGCNT